MTGDVTLRLCSPYRDCRTLTRKPTIYCLKTSESPFRSVLPLNCITRLYDKSQSFRCFTTEYSKYILHPLTVVQIQFVKTRYDADVDVATRSCSAGDLPTSPSSGDLSESSRLPLVIREKDVEYQVMTASSGVTNYRQCHC